MSNQLTSLHNTRSPAQVPITNRQKDRGCSLLPIPGLQPENHRDREREREREEQQGFKYNNNGELEEMGLQLTNK
jgi:hypothetical protein